MTKQFTIYKTTNIIDGCFYIGVHNWWQGRKLIITSGLEVHHA
jgi:hypothetical protein